MNEPRQIFYLAGKRERKMRGTLVEDRTDLAGEREITVKKRTNTATIKADDIVEEKAEAVADKWSPVECAKKYATIQGALGDDAGRDQATSEIIKGGEAYRLAIENASNQTRIESQHLPQPDGLPAEIEAQIQRSTEGIDEVSEDGKWRPREKAQAFLRERFKATRHLLPVEYPQSLKSDGEAPSGIPRSAPEMAQGEVLPSGEHQTGGQPDLPSQGAAQSRRRSPSPRTPRKSSVRPIQVDGGLQIGTQRNQGTHSGSERIWASFAGLEHYGAVCPQTAPF